jgi:hypothetical protein
VGGGGKNPYGILLHKWVPAAAHGQFFYYVFRATRSKTTSLPAALNQARRIDTLDEFYLYEACKTVLHIIETIVVHCYMMRSDFKNTS